MTVYLIITCCIHNTSGIQFGDRRKSEYFIAISYLLSQVPEGIKPIIVENSCEGKSYLDVFNCDIMYTQDNTTLIENENKLLHKGYRELIDIKKVIEKYNIQDDDTIIKFTGRYQLFTNEFFNTVLANPDKDAIFRQFNVMTYAKDDISIIMGMFALRCKYLKAFKYENYDVGCEQEFREFINKYVDPDKILKVDKLWLRCCIGMNHKLVDV